VNRLLEVAPEPGGKAAHVAMAIHAVGEEPLWLGFAGGATGRELIDGLQALGIKTQAIETQRPTRVNLEVVDDAGMVTEILEPGPPISHAELDRFREACSKAFSQMKDGAQVIFSGSLPPGAPADLYAELIRAARLAGCRTSVDTSGEALKSALEQKPDFVKPNREEAESLTGEAVTDLTSAKRAIAQILVCGARSIASSLGKDGLLWRPAENEPLVYAQHPAIIRHDPAWAAVTQQWRDLPPRALATCRWKKWRDGRLRAVPLTAWHLPQGKSSWPMSTRWHRRFAWKGSREVANPREISLGFKRSGRFCDSP
jgi:tagatose 6-phosphate kinase